MKHILILEDDVSLAGAISEIVLHTAPAGAARVSKAQTCGEAAALLEGAPVDLFILDVYLPDASGLAFAEQLRGMPRYAMTPMLFMTGDAALELQVYRRTGCYHFLSKPFELEKLQKLLRLFFSDALADPSEPAPRIRAHREGIYYPIQISEIVYVETEGRSLKLHTDEGVYIVPHMTLSGFMLKLGDDFVQCHRSILVRNTRLQDRGNLNEVGVSIGGTSESIYVSRTHRKHIQALLKRF